MTIQRVIHCARCFFDAVLTLVPGILLLTLPFAAQEPAEAGNPPALSLHPLLAGMPGARNTPAPAWVRPGARISYYSASAATYHAGGRVSLVPDPGGDWSDANGNSYKESAIPSGTGGAGYTQIDVVAVRRDAVLCEMRSYILVNGLQGPTKLGRVTPVRVHPSGCDFWIQPALLKRWVGTNTGGVSIQRLNYKVEGRTFDALYINTKVQGGTVSYAYDAATGVLLSYNASSRAQRPGMALNRSGMNSGTLSRTYGRNIAIHRFRGLRQVDLPWKAAPAPKWTRRFQGASYRGAITTAMPGMPPLRLPLSSTVQVRRRLGDWVECEVVARMHPGDPNFPVLPSRAVKIQAPGQVGGLWMAPSAMRQLRKGQILDRDPVTGGIIGVLDRGRGPQGRPVVVIRESGQTDPWDYTYDARTGMLLSFRKTEVFAATRTVVTTEVFLAN